jgi:hypothetical protein
MGLFYNSALHFEDGSLSGDVIQYSITTPVGFEWLTIDQTTGYLSGVPDDKDVGDFQVQITAESSGGLVTNTVYLTVENVNDIPIISGTFNALSVLSGANSSGAIYCVDDDIVLNKGYAEYQTIFGVNDIYKDGISYLIEKQEGQYGHIYLQNGDTLKWVYEADASLADTANVGFEKFKLEIFDGYELISKNIDIIVDNTPIDAIVKDFNGNLLDGFIIDSVETPFAITGGELRILNDVNLNNISLLEGSYNFAEAITLDDVIGTLKSVSGIATLDGANAVAADINSDGFIDLDDVIGILKSVAGISDMSGFSLVDENNNKITTLHESTGTTLNSILVAHGDVDMSGSFSNLLEMV